MPSRTAAPGVTPQVSPPACVMTREPPSWKRQLNGLAQKLPLTPLELDGERVRRRVDEVGVVVAVIEDAGRNRSRNEREGEVLHRRALSAPGVPAPSGGSARTQRRDSRPRRARLFAGCTDSPMQAIGQ